MKRWQTEAQILLQVHLAELGIETVAEFRFDQERKFRFDLADVGRKIGFECNGHWQGKHGAGWSEGFEKLNLAQAQGWKVFVFHNREVLNGKAKAFLAEQERLLSRSGQPAALTAEQMCDEITAQLESENWILSSLDRLLIKAIVTKYAALATRTEVKDGDS